jgi:hypothetical protein
MHGLVILILAGYAALASTLIYIQITESSDNTYAEGTNASRNAGIQRRQSQVLSLATTLSRSVPNTNRGLSTNSPWTGAGQRIFFLHDGRTNNLLQAIEAHESKGSEANHVAIRGGRLDITPYLFPTPAAHATASPAHVASRALPSTLAP